MMASRHCNRSTIASHYIASELRIMITVMGLELLGEIVLQMHPVNGSGGFDKILIIECYIQSLSRFDFTTSVHVRFMKLGFAAAFWISSYRMSK
jgi:hypothetical protein